MHIWDERGIIVNRSENLFDLSQYDRRPASELAFLALRQAILLGHLPPGTRLLANELAEKMGVSRTPVREALQKLELEGLVESAPWRGVVVANQDMKDIEEFYEIRGALEGVVAYFGARRRPQARLEGLRAAIAEMKKAVEAGDAPLFLRHQVTFYDHYVELAQSKRLKQLVSSIRDQLDRNKWISVQAPGRMQTSLAGMEAVVDAIERGEAAEAARLAQQHCRKAYEAFRAMAERMQWREQVAADGAEQSSLGGKQSDD